jgi:hypothetical protein
VEYHGLPLDIQQWEMETETKKEQKEEFEERKVGKGEKRERKNK